MFSISIPEADPRIICEQKKTNGHNIFETRYASGLFFRVYPKTCREVSALQMLQHHVDKFAPADGNGIIITKNAMMKFMSMKNLPFVG
jgi:hypothetical protein